MNFPSELENVWKTPSSRSRETWYRLRKLWFGHSSACRQKAIISRSLLLSLSLSLIKHQLRREWQAHAEPTCFVGPVCACLKPCRTPACLCHRGSKRNNSDESTENTHTQNESTHQSKRANWHPHRPLTRWEWVCAPAAFRRRARTEGRIIPRRPILCSTAASRDEPYSPFLSRSCSLTGSSISISRSLSSSFQRQLSLNQSNYQPQNRPQTHLPVHLCLSRLSPCLLWAQTAPPCWIAQRVSDVFFFFYCLLFMHSPVISLINMQTAIVTCFFLLWSALF